VRQGQEEAEAQLPIGSILVLIIGIILSVFGLVGIVTQLDEAEVGIISLLPGALGILIGVSLLTVFFTKWGKMDL
jgi:hypothetical protein